MDILDLEIPGVKLIRPSVFKDGRGFFQQTYHQAEYAKTGIPETFVQDNWSRSEAGVLRGLHYQLKNPQAKLVSVLRGRIFDVAVDIRRGSPSFGKWCGTMLDEENHYQLYIPAGFAHGFMALDELNDIVYKCTGLYAPGDEYGIAWNDASIGIEWPEFPKPPSLSAKDAVALQLKDIPPENLPVMENK
ncbi:MAG: dTDP-4-dehydrorhamnose 3,5-epimerase [Verrucomicrobiota bacterium]